MKKLVLLTFATLSLASFAGCKKKGGGAADAYKAYVEDYCKCVDQKDKAGECAKAATDKYNKENAPKADEKPDPEAIAQMVKDTAEATKKFSECTTKITAAATAGAGGGGDMKKPEGGDMKKPDEAKPEEKKPEEPKKEEAAKPEEKKEEPKTEEKK